jgi:beta propeller repeat protein
MVPAVILAVLAIIGTLAVGAVEAQAPRVRVSAPVVLAGGPGSQRSPALSRGLMVYSTCRAGNCDVWGLDLNTKQSFPISQGDWDEQQPATDGLRAVWRDGRNTELRDYENPLANFDIYGANLDDRKPYLISKSAHLQNRPSVWGNTAVWADFRDAQGSGDQDAGNVYQFDIPGAKESTVTTAPSAQTRPVTNGQVVVWQDYRNEPDQDGDNSDLYGYDSATGQEFAISTPPGAQIDPAISGNMVVWADYRKGDGTSDIYGYDLAGKREFQVTSAPGSQIQPAIWGNIVVWADLRNDKGQVRAIDLDIYGYDLTSKQEFEVFVGPGQQTSPRVASGVVAWEDGSAGNTESDIIGATISGLALTEPASPPPLVPGSGSRKFPETGQTVYGVFLDYWQKHGGLAQQGFPISGVMTETSDLDGKVYKVQYFERAVFEYHPELAGANKVLLSQLGTFRYKAKYPNGPTGQPALPDPSSRTFAETDKTVSGRFLQYWEQSGGLAQQGFPISEPFMETSDLDGKPYLVQYFERAVFEYHPENPVPYDVLLSQLGTFRYKAKYGARP